MIIFQILAHRRQIGETLIVGRTIRITIDVVFQLGGGFDFETQLKGRLKRTAQDGARRCRDRLMQRIVFDIA